MQILSGAWPPHFRTRAPSKSSSQMSHFNQSQPGFGWFVSELQGGLAKGIKTTCNLGSSRSRLTQSPKRRAAPQTVPKSNSSSPAHKTATMQEFFFFFHFTVRASGLGLQAPQQGLRPSLLWKISVS